MLERFDVKHSMPKSPERRRRNLGQRAEVRLMAKDLGYEIDRVIEACIYGARRPECAGIARRRRIGLRHVLTETLVETLCREFDIRRRRPSRRPSGLGWIDRALIVVCWPWFWLTCPARSVPHPVVPSVRGIGHIWESRARAENTRSEYAHPLVDIAWGVREMTRHLLEHYEQEPWRSELLAESRRSGLPLADLLADAITHSLLEQYSVSEKDEADEVPF
jgi:hypothetical protein